MTTLVCLFAIFVFAVDAQVFPSLLAGIEGTSAHHGLLLSALFALFPVTSALAGYAADRLGKRRVLAAGAALMAIPFVVASTADALWAWIATAVFFGMGSGIVEGQSSALLSDAHPGRERWAVSLSQAFYCIGAVGGPFAVALALRLLPAMRNEHTFAAAAVLSIVLFAAFLSLRDTRAHARAARPVGLRTLLRDPEWRLLCVSLFLYVGAESCTAGWLAKYGATVLGMSEASAPLCIAAFWAGLGISRAVTAAIPSHIDSRSLLLGSLAVALSTHVLAFSVSAVPAAIVLFAGMGVGMGCVWPALVAHAGSRYRHSSGSAVGILVAAGGLAIPIIQPLVGWVSALPGIGLRGALLSLAALTAVNLVVVLRMFSVESRPARRPSGDA